MTQQETLDNNEKEIVDTKYGKIQGYLDGGLHVFKGIFDKQREL